MMLEYLQALVYLRLPLLLLLVGIRVPLQPYCVLKPLSLTSSVTVWDLDFTFSIPSFLYCFKEHPDSLLFLF